MSNQSLSTIPLFGDADFYLPLKVAERFNFPLSHHIIDKRFWGSIQDWLVGLTGDIPNAQKAWTKFQTSDTFRQLSTSSRVISQDLPYTVEDGRVFQTAHGSEYLLYHLTLYLRSTKARPQVAAVKAYLAESGVIVGEIVRDPEGMGIKLLELPDNQTTRKELKDIRRATDSGYSFEEGRQRINAREGLKEANKRVSAARADTGLVTTNQHYAALADHDFLVGVTVSREEWKTLHGIYSDINEHLSTLDLVALTYAKEAIADLYAKRDPRTYTQLFEIANEIKEDVERVRRVYSRLVPGNALKKIAKPKQLKAGE